jgi:hypothetical protein
MADERNRCPRSNAATRSDPASFTYRFTSALVSKYAQAASIKTPLVPHEAYEPPTPLAAVAASISAAAYASPTP